MSSGLKIPTPIGTWLAALLPCLALAYGLVNDTLAKVSKTAARMGPLYRGR